MRNSPIDTLTAFYQEYCENNGLPQVSADEQKFEQLERNQRRFMFQFMTAWDACQELEDIA